MRSFLIATRYLTIVPVGPSALDPDGRALGRAAPWFPAVGLALGAVLAVTASLAERLFPTLVAAAVVVAVWKLLTGGLHLDGLADCLDALSGRTPAERLRIMRDSRIGAFGAVGLGLVLLLGVAAVAELPATVRMRALLSIPAIGRTGPVLLARAVAAARAEGQGATFAAGVPGHASPVGLAFTAAAVGAVLGVAGLVALAVGVLTALAVGRFYAARVGGTTGDVLGAAVELAELSALLTVVAWTRLRP